MIAQHLTDIFMKLYSVHKGKYLAITICQRDLSIIV